MARKKKPARAGLCDRRAAGDRTVWERLVSIRPVVRRVARVPQQYCLPEDPFCYDFEGDEFPAGHGDYSRPWPPFLLFRLGTVPPKAAALGLAPPGGDAGPARAEPQGGGPAAWQDGAFALLVEFGPRDVRFRGKAGADVREVARVPYGDPVLAELQALGVGLDDEPNPTYLRPHHQYCYRVWCGLLAANARLLAEALVGDWHLSDDPYRYDVIKLRLADPGAAADRLVIRFEEDRIRVLLPRAEKGWDDRPTEVRAFGYADPADTLEDFLRATGFTLPAGPPPEDPPGYAFLTS